nr:MAG TPA: hypothetical protein [Caudoviricetes sp.]
MKSLQAMVCFSLLSWNAHKVKLLIFIERIEF